MPARLGPALTRRAAIVMGAALLACAMSASTARAQTSARIAASLSPNRLGSLGALTLTVRFAEEESGVPAPVRGSILRLPTELGIEIPELRSCAVARLLARGPSGCPPQSRIGAGHALAEAHLGSQAIAESIALWVFVGPPHNLQPSFEILGQGYTPFDERMVLTGTVLPDAPPYGEDLEISIPPIHTLPLEPDASILTLSLSFGAARRAGSHAGNAIRVPRRCPSGGFPFAASFTYADGSSGSASAQAPCPR
jgi:hypothetical protein